MTESGYQLWRRRMYGNSEDLEEIHKGMRLMLGRAWNTMAVLPVNKEYPSLTHTAFGFEECFYVDNVLKDESKIILLDRSGPERDRIRVFPDHPGLISSTEPCFPSKYFFLDKIRFEEGMVTYPTCITSRENPSPTIFRYEEFSLSLIHLGKRGFPLEVLRLDTLCFETIASFILDFLNKKYIWYGVKVLGISLRQMAVPAERQFSKGPIALRCDAICSKLVRGIYSGISYESILETFVLDISQEDIDPTAGLDRYIDLEWVYQNASSDQLIRERLIEGELS